MTPGTRAEEEGPAVVAPRKGARVGAKAKATQRQRAMLMGLALPLHLTSTESAMEKTREERMRQGKITPAEPLRYPNLLQLLHVVTI
jgi:hypothetical protein